MREPRMTEEKRLGTSAPRASEGVLTLHANLFEYWRTRLARRRKHHE